ncbi:MAG: class I SAM-dependent methyltransferase [Bacteroidetes bacterium]|nr:class I SAM-dependent methyltransferase [Bacteroidota bacterium]
MQIDDAIKMLEHDRVFSTQKSIWADLGCGEGTFTLALASLLHEKSIIYAIDKNKSSLDNIPNRYKNSVIKKEAGDFVTMDFLFQNADGILMANSLHYVRDKKTFINKIAKCLKEEGVFMVVEYDTDIANAWVPYPVRFSVLKNLFSTSGFSFIQSLHERKSIYNNVMMYTALIRRK